MPKTAQTASQPRVRFLAAAVLAGLSASPASAANLVPGTSCPVFRADSWWHADISTMPVHTRSAQWMSNMSPARDLHPDFGPSYGVQPAPYGIPITVVAGSHAAVTVTFDYASESDQIPYPLGSDTKVEGGQWVSGDRHTALRNLGHSAHGFELAGGQRRVLAAYQQRLAPVRLDLGRCGGSAHSPGTPAL
jgi:hypothetical protein